MTLARTTSSQGTRISSPSSSSSSDCAVSRIPRCAARHAVRRVRYAGAICGTLINFQILDYRWIAVGSGASARVIGYPLGMWVPMTALPQRIAISHSVRRACRDAGRRSPSITAPPRRRRHHRCLAHGGARLRGAARLTDRDGRAHGVRQAAGAAALHAGHVRGQNLVNFVLFITSRSGSSLPDHQSGKHGRVLCDDRASPPYSACSMVLPIGGADMPVVVSLLNSYAGLAAAATGFAIGNNVLIICRRARRRIGFLLSIYDVEGDEPFVRQRHSSARSARCDRPRKPQHPARAFPFARSRPKTLPCSSPMRSA